MHFSALKLFLQCIVNNLHFIGNLLVIDEKSDYFFMGNSYILRTYSSVLKKLPSKGMVRAYNPNMRIQQGRPTRQARKKFPGEKFPDLIILANLF